MTPREANLALWLLLEGWYEIQRLCRLLVNTELERQALEREVEALKAENERLESALEEPTCLHPWHDNPALITPCPECGDIRL